VLALQKAKHGPDAFTVQAMANVAADYASLSADQASALIKRLEADMRKHAENLEFEEAARLRDRIHQLRELAAR